jgi:hypothetical protein
VAHPDADAILKEYAQRPDGLGAFARWTRLARNAELLGPTPRHDERDEPPADGADFALLWQTCRRTPPGERGPLLDTLRANSVPWRRRLSAYLASADPRDRLLALQVVSFRDLAARHRQQIKALLNDPSEGIRRIAEHLLKTLDPSNPSEAPPPGRPALATDEWPLDGATARKRLTELLDRLTGAGEGADAQLVAEVRSLMEIVYSADASREETRRSNGV